MCLSIQNTFSGRVSRGVLLSGLLPLSLAAFCVSVSIGIWLFPEAYDWRRCVLSRVISPRHNPQGCWAPSIGFALAALLVLPFAGYVQQRLRPITPRLAGMARWAFTLGFLLVWGVVLSSHLDLGPGFHRLHRTLAHVSTAFTAFGVVCCSLCALSDRLRILGGRQRLHRRLTLSWTLITVLPLICGLLSGTMLLGRKADHAWAMHASGWVRPTMLWQLAFWEWIGLGLLFVFLFLSVLWLPEQGAFPAPSLARTRPLPEAGRDGQDPCLSA